MMMLIYRPSDSDIVESVGDDDDAVTKPTSTSVADSSKHVTDCSVPEVLRTTPSQHGAAVEIVNEKSSPTVRNSDHYSKAHSKYHCVTMRPKARWTGLICCTHQYYHCQ